MSKVVKTVFGGTDDSAQKAQVAANRASQSFIESQTKRAEQTATPLFSAAEQNILAGNQAALDAFGGFAPQQFQALQQGNLAAQAAILGGQPQLSGFAVDTSFIPQQLPQFRTIQQALQPQDPLQNAINSNPNLAALFRGLGNAGP